MRPKSLMVLGAAFLCAFAGRAVVFAQSIAADPGASISAPPDEITRCIDGAFAQTLKAGFKDLESSKRAVAEKEQEVKILSEHVEKRLQELEALNQRVLASAEKMNARRDEEAQRVAAIYEQMKPQLAGPIIGGMDPDFAAGLLLAMNGESASSIMATLDPKRAYAITVMMASKAQAQ